MDVLVNIARPSFKLLNFNFLLIMGLFLIESNELNGQVVILPCQAETDGTIGLDRNNWNGGATTFHSEGIMHNFDIPTNTFGDCKRLSNIEFQLTVNNIDMSGLDPACNVFDFFINFSNGCGSFAPASCDFIFNQVQGFPVTQTINFPIPPNTFDFGDIFGADIIPAMADVTCPNGTSTITSGAIVMDYEICVTITVVDEMISSTPDLGVNQTICPLGTTTLDPGTFDSYAWDPNGETTPTITTGPGTYTVTVTDNKGCTATDEITVSPFPASPITFNPTTPMVCDNGNTTVNVTEIYGTYDWSNSMSGQSQNLTPGIYQVTITDANNCTATNSVEVFNVPPPNAGSDNALEVCNNGSTYDIAALLMAHDAGGMWTDNDGSGVDLNANSTAVDFSAVIPSTYTFTYEVAGMMPCPADQAVITIDVMQESFAGVSTSETFCQDPGVIDLFFLLGNPDTGGSWIDQNNSNVDLNNPFIVNMNGVAAGSYTYQYTVGNGGACPDQSSTLTITITDGANAGSDAEITVCEGVQFDLIDLLSGPDFGGIFLDTDGSNALAGSIVNTVGLAGLSYNFTYLVGSAADPCGEDEATITLNIEASLTAGIGTTDTFCIGGELDLFDFLTNENNGGTFDDINGSGGLIGSMLNTTSILSGTYIYRYYVGDGQTCPRDSSDIVLSFNNGPEYDFNLSNAVLCPNQCENIDLNFVGIPPFTFPLEIYSTSNNQLIISQEITTNSNSYSFSACSSMDSTYFNNDTLNLLCDSTWIVRVPTLEDTRCIASGESMIDTILINTPKASRFDVDTTICISDTLDFNGTLLYFGNSTYFDTIQGSSCDSIININVTFSDIDTVYEEPTICRGDSVMIRGEWYSETYPSASINIINPSGCDSLLLINIGFYQQAESLINRMLCNGDSIVVNGVTYDIDNPSGEEIIISASSNGCDSIVTIDLTFSNSVMLSRTDTLCFNDTIVIEGTVFDNQNTTGQFLLDNSGCDTMLIVDLTFLDLARNEVRGTFCPDYSIEVNGVTYDVTNPIGIDTILNGSVNGCDSIIDVQLNFHQASSSDFIQTICDDESILINGTVYDSSNTSGIEVIPMATMNGCDSMINVNLTVIRSVQSTNPIEICMGDSLFVGGAWQLTAGTYIDTLIGSNSCDSIVTTELTVNSCTFNVEVILNQVVCFGDSTGSILLSLLTAFNNDITLTWSGLSTGFTGSLTIDNIGDFTIENLPADNYNIVVTDINNMVVWESNQNIININPEITGMWTVQQAISCAGETGTFVFLPQGGMAPYSYEWNPSSIGDTPIANNVISGDYNLTVTDNNDCTFEANFNFTEPLMLNASISVFGNSCEDATDGEIHVENITGGTGDYAILINNNLSSEITSDLPSGNYDIVISDENNCMLSFTEVLTADQSFELADYTDTYTIKEGDSVDIEGVFFSTDLTFTWIDPNGDLSCTDCGLPIIKTNVDNSYDVTVTDINGCSETYTIAIIIETLEVKTIAPNIFSPNGDGNNDDFIYTNLSSNVLGLSLDVYDRWGNRVHFSAVGGNTISWNGTSNGSKVASGVYIYTINITQSDGSIKTIFGDVLIMY